MVPRGKVLLLGGIAEEDQWNTKENLITYQPYRDMLHRCQKFMPFLKSATVIEEEVRESIAVLFMCSVIYTYLLHIIYISYSHQVIFKHVIHMP